MLLIVLNLFLSILSFASCQDGFDTNCLDAHNEYRKKHGSPPMKWSASLAADAQKWADQLAREDKFEHDMKSVKSKNQGENLAYFSPPKKKCMGAKKDDCVQCSEMVADWYNEVNDYDFSTGKAKVPGKVYLHFTQVVWKESVEVGVGVGIGKNYGFITVARYSPRGNMGGAEDFKKNVLPQGATPSTGPGTTPPTTPAPGATPSTGLGTTPPTTPAPGATPSTGPGTTPPTTPPPGSTTSRPNTPSTSKPEESSNCEYLIITTITKQKKIIQKCKGKPNVTFVPSSAVVGVPPSPKTASSTNPPTTVQTGAPATSSPTTIPSGGSTGPTLPGTSSDSTTLTPTGGKTGPTNPSQKPKVGKNQHDKSLMLINLYRVMHGAPPLFWNDQLEKESQAWAEQLAQKGTLEHDTSMKDGENIAKLPASNSDVMNAVDAWYDEEKMFDYKNPGFSKATGHFTQLAWKGSKEMGLGIAPSKDKSEYYIVARFRPSGNVQGKFVENVGPKVST